MSFKRFVKNSFFFATIASLLLSCLDKESKSDAYIKKAQQAISLNQLQEAKIFIDSISVVAPQDYDKIREGRHLLQQIDLLEQKRTRAYCDSLLQICQTNLPQKKKNFVYQLNKAYESTGHYVHSHQLFKNNHYRTYIQANVSEDGQLFMISRCVSSLPIEHNRLRLYAQDGTYAETEIVPKDDAFNYSFKDENTYYETIYFNEKNNANVTEFLSMHEYETVTVELLGKNRPIKYVMKEEDKEALLQAVELSTILSDITWLLDEIRLSQAKINYFTSSPK